jgi:hypothetical protein
MNENVISISTPAILRIDRLLKVAPSVKFQPLVGLVHRQVVGMSEGNLAAFVGELFEECWLAELSPSEALSLVWNSNAGREFGFRKLAASDVWERYGRQCYDNRILPEPPLLEPVPPKPPSPNGGVLGSRRGH